MAKKADSTYVNYMRYDLESLNNKTIGFDYFIEPILQSTDEELSSTELREIFTRFFKHLTGIEPYTKCPLCGAELLPHEGYNKYYVACTGYPQKCKFIADKKQKFISKQEYITRINTEKEIIKKASNLPPYLWQYLVIWAEKTLFDYNCGRSFLKDFSKRFIKKQHITFRQAKYALDLYEKATVCGFDYQNDYQLPFSKIEHILTLPTNVWYDLLIYLIDNDSNAWLVYEITSFITEREQNAIFELPKLHEILSIYEESITNGFQPNDQ